MCLEGIWSECQEEGVCSEGGVCVWMEGVCLEWRVCVKGGVWSGPGVHPDWWPARQLGCSVV